MRLILNRLKLSNHADREKMADQSPDESALANATRFLKTVRTASLATTDPNALPHAANVQFFSDEDCCLYFLSSKKSAHATHIAHQTHVAVSVYDHDDRPEMIRGIQMRGQCTDVASPEERAALMSLYVQKFPIACDPAFVQMVNRQTLYQIQPTWLRWIDNRVRFGFKLEWVLES